MTAEKFTLNIEKLEDRNQTANILIYGEPGTGKTTFASTAPRPILWLEAEGGTNSIGDKTGIDIVRMDGLESYREVLRYLHAKPDAYKTVVIDSISETSAAVLSEIMREVASADYTRDEFLPQFGEWGKLTGVMRAILRSYRDLDVNVIFTALTREDKDDLTGATRVRPKLTPALAEDVLSFMDAGLYLAARTPKRGEVGAEGVEADEDGITIVRNALLKPTGKYAAKMRAPQGTEVPDFLTDPTFDDVAALMGLGGK